ncbi:phospholipid transport system transporter-binding protein [Pseudomonas fluvialis]|uniref:Phospholipid transport system transporter-binding protein n=1 Tax=Pseudomonas fluvialis TaxID=1793966 RepID=A0A7X0ESW9_9PSED|nr:STAS domain-containing protein [Pseudomonas fluvialis]MBB6339996.1 phospholipid transport system transporter-binding protein [Pseudomonas fluvialis]
MSEANLTLAADGVLSLVGVLDYRSGPALREQGRQLITGCTKGSVLLDCAGVSKSSSVGLALVLAFMRDARGAGKQLALRNLPEDMREIAQVSGLGDLLPLQA